MRSLALTGAAVLISTGLAFAVDPATESTDQDIKGLSPSGPTAKEAPATPNPSASGRPSAILDDSECQNVWKEAIDGGSDLTANKAGKYISNFKQADANDDGRISEAEFNEACSNGWVQAAADGGAGMQSGAGETEPSAPSSSSQ